MEPVSVIVGALVAGASSALKDTAAQAVKDAYSGLKTILVDGYKLVSIQLLERDPSSKNFRETVKQELAIAHAPEDVKVLEQAQALLDVLEREPQVASIVAGVELKKVKAQADIVVREMRTKGPAAMLHDVEAGGSIRIENIDTTDGDAAHPKN